MVVQRASWRSEELYACIAYAILYEGFIVWRSSVTSTGWCIPQFPADNLLKTVPDEVGHLKSLSNLDLHSNQLTEFPAKACSLRLSLLDLSNNNLSGLPFELGMSAVLIEEPVQDVLALDNIIFSIFSKGQGSLLKQLELRSSHAIQIAEFPCLLKTER